MRLAALPAVALLAGGALTWIGHPEHHLSMTAVGELWADVFRDADRFGLQLTRIPAAQEMDLGHKLAQRLLAGQIVDTARRPRLLAITQRLLPHVDRKDIRYEFHILQAPTINAFALPGGHVFVYTGLIDLLQTDDELAAVVGHEIAHIDQRHVVERYQYEMRLRGLGMGDLAGLAQLPHALVHAGYAQYQEIEADAVGMRLAVAAGYKPEGAVDAIRTLLPSNYAPMVAKRPLEEMAKLGIETVRDYFRSHPPTAERIRRLEALAARHKSSR